jgi:hypothetical protein
MLVMSRQHKKSLLLSSLLLVLPWLPAPCIIMPAAGSTHRCPIPGKDGNPLGTESSSTVTVESD